MTRRRKAKDEKREAGRPSMYPGKVRRPNSVILTDTARELAEQIAGKLSEREGREISRSDAIEDCIRVRAAQFGLTVAA
jgi:hypothetical protein